MASQNQFIGFAVDPTATGSTKDILGVSPTFATPTVYVPVTTAQVNQGYTNIERNNEVRGQRGQVPEVPFQALPTLTFTTRLYPSLAAFFLPKALGGTITSTGTAPAAITSKVGVSSVTLPALQALVVRGTQTDRLTGLWTDSVELNVPEDGDPTITVTMRGLFHKHYPTSSPPTPTFTSENPYSTVTLTSKIGSAGTPIACVGTMSLTLDNQLVDDRKQIFCKGENVETTTVAGKYMRRQYPGRHKLGDHQISGSLEFGTERTDIEDRLRVAQADKLVFELTADPITPATTPAADELLRLTVPMSQFTGGSASELTDERDPDSTYQFGGYIDPADGSTFFAEFVRKTAVA